MSKIYYCVDCKRVGTNSDVCLYCNGTYLKPITQGTSVNIIGTKKKGRVLKVKQNEVLLILVDDMNNKFVKEVLIEDIRKVL
ncbi:MULTISPECIES: hypothetical protein [Clostridium]|uniref:Uncharacterized protein n=1 Tax=Clostridium senegalense TaxID=1465809 RepID=A0A6M0H406_9CLOT|nr:MULTISPECIES: hypothetical protein [Clostridium]NEU04813.1 hypothetical protein [Clostridium senegalense]